MGMNIKKVLKEAFALMKSDWYLPVTEHQVYSTGEVKCGVWTDGKPIYRKTVVLNTAVQLIGSQWTNITQLAEAETLVGAEFYNDNIVRNIQTYLLDGGYLKGYIDGSGNLNINKAVIEYTKTTDTAQSPKVPYEPLVEYSTDEKFIGYWSDGKALYERTVLFTTPSTAGSYVSIFPLPQDGKCVFIDGMINNMIPINFRGSSDQYYSMCIADAGEIKISVSSGYRNLAAHAVIKYTKDSAA